MLFQIAATMEFARKHNVEYSFPNLKEHLHYVKNETHFNPNLKCVKHYEHLFRNLKTIKPSNTIKKINFPFHYVDWEIPKNCLIEGFFQSEKYFKQSRTKILSLFEKTSTINKVSVHIRRGDYIKNPNYHNVLSKKYYDKAFEMFPNHEFLIFSDDIEWCKNNFIGQRYLFYTEKTDLEEMVAMSSCEHNIIANSSFSWWGAWLNINKNKKIICPSQWVGPAFSSLNTKDIYCEDWIKI